MFTVSTQNCIKLNLVLNANATTVSSKFTKMPPESYLLNQSYSSLQSLLFPAAILGLLTTHCSQSQNNLP